MAARDPITLPAPAEMADLLVEVVAGVAGGSNTVWRKRAGVVDQQATDQTAQVVPTDNSLLGG